MAYLGLFFANFCLFGTRQLLKNLAASENRTRIVRAVIKDADHQDPISKRSFFNWAIPGLFIVYFRLFYKKVDTN